MHELTEDLLQDVISRISEATEQNLADHEWLLAELYKQLDRHLPDPPERAVPTSLLKSLADQLAGVINMMQTEENQFVRATILHVAGLSRAMVEAALAHRPDGPGSPLADAQVITYLMRECEGVKTETDPMLLKVRAGNALETAIAIISGDHKNV